MANKKFLIGILVMVLVFGVTVVGCDNGTTGETGGDINYLDFYNWSTAPLTSQALSASGMTQAQFQTIRNAADRFLGWAIDDYSGDFLMAWLGSSYRNFHDVADAIEALPGRSGATRGVGAAFNYAHGSGFRLDHYPGRAIIYDNIYIPAGALLALFW